ncbi:MAG: hypothetical protein LBU92_01255 [Prevotellaceae bacterium]|jgi:hypothetical protein|nr:hypothetical protein [Prevotellaceae bacterium]
MLLKKVIVKKSFALAALLMLCLGVAQAQLSSRSRIGDLFGIPMRPYAGAQIGILSFYGDVRPHSGHNWLTGKPGEKFDFMLEIGSEGTYAAKISFMHGIFNESQAYPWVQMEVSANPEKYSLDPNSPSYAPQYHRLSSYQEGNLNFRTNLFSIGLQGEYRIQNIPTFRNITPYVSTGFNLLIFNPYSDLSYEKGGQPVLYELDRLEDYIEYGTPPSSYLPGQITTGPRDNKYETQLSSANLYGEGKFSTVTLGIPLEVGFDFRVMPTVNLRIGSSFTFTLTDNIDGVSGKVARAATFNPELEYYDPVNRASRLQTNKSNDFFVYTYVACYFYLPFL